MPAIHALVVTLVEAANAPGAKPNKPPIVPWPVNPSNQQVEDTYNDAINQVQGGAKAILEAWAALAGVVL